MSNKISLENFSAKQAKQKIVYLLVQLQESNFKSINKVEKGKAC